MSQMSRNELFQMFAKLKDDNHSLSRENIGTGIQDERRQLERCQNEAIQIGTKIEGIYGEGTIAVECLESYCEILYQISQVSNSIQKKKLYQNLCMVLENAYENMKRELPDRKEIVFFPYNASMWDSMESVWMEATKDPELDVYVVPIPYFDKNPDGSFGEMHYEIDLYPDYVSVIDWQSYSVEVRKPDVVCVHNPYDNGNVVTSVHPLYYIKNLKKSVGKVVYIPYFVLGEYVAEHFCVNAGTLFSDTVVLQSESIKTQYVHYMNKFIRENGYDKYFTGIERKIMALGSPKIDKVVHYKKEKGQISKEWEKIIDKKKIVLYNTSVAALIKHKEDALRKIKSVIAYFEKQEDVILWWRPHPLDEATIRAIYPTLVTELQNMIEKYKENKMGIFDDTPDMIRALAYADMYYGDDSSLVYIFGMLGKPIMLQNQSILFSAVDFNGESETGMMVNYLDVHKQHECGKLFECKAQMDSESCMDYIYMESRSMNLIHIVKELKDKVPIFHQQKLAFAKCFANADGTAGEKIINYIKKDANETDKNII